VLAFRNEAPDCSRPIYVVPRYLSNRETDVPVGRFAERVGTVVCEPRRISVDIDGLDRRTILAFGPPGQPVSYPMVGINGEESVIFDQVEEKPRDVVFVPVAAFDGAHSARIQGQSVSLVDVHPLGEKTLNAFVATSNRRLETRRSQTCNRWSYLSARGWTRLSSRRAPYTALYKCGHRYFVS
jgi:hypothetical protein